MTASKITELLELIAQAVNGDGSWIEKRNTILAEANDDDKINLVEFAGWFEN